MNNETPDIQWEELLKELKGVISDFRLNFVIENIEYHEDEIAMEGLIDALADEGTTLSKDLYDKVIVMATFLNVLDRCSNLEEFVTIT